ncbi:2OG-Fe dioxygenase family protein [uncultured Bradyrhizobium sp.]|uniref:2OG-Fe dioxygenase family protein n=1 Tax=uncultured Bradyrhizobium sp. TaxID=199684 RepID=UPI0035CB44DF
MMNQGQLARTPAPLEQFGFEKFAIGAADVNLEIDSHLDQIKSEFDALRRDPYGPSDNRFRSYARGLLLPWRSSFEWIPHTTLVNGHPTTEYFQGPYNPHFSGERRILPSITEKTKSNPLLLRLIWLNFDRTFWPKELRAYPLQVGVSFIKLQVDTENRRALSTPDNFHQDGETFTFAHLVKRNGVLGGINAITHPSGAGKTLHEVPRDDLLAEFELRQPLESYAIFDPMVSHYVSPIELAEGNRGERSIMLIDFTPMITQHHVPR